MSQVNGTDVGGVEFLDPPEMVNIELTAAGSSEDECNGAVLKLSDAGESGQSLMSGLSGPQCRELAAELLKIADAASRGAERTVMCVTVSQMWSLPGQFLTVRTAPDGAAHFEFAVRPGSVPLMQPRKRLIVPGR